MKVDFETLKNMSYEDGSDMLYNLGYILADSVRETESNISDFVEIVYFKLYDNDEEIDCIDYNLYYNGSDDNYIIVEECWDSNLRNL